MARRSRDVVAGLGDEGEGVGAEAEDEGRDDVGQRQRHGELQDALHLRLAAEAWTCMLMSSLCRGDWRFNFG